MPKRVSALSLIVLLVLSLLTSESAQAGRVIDPKTESLGLLFTENMELTSMTSAIYGRVFAGSSTSDYKLCRSIRDPKCDAASELLILQFFDICPTQTAVNCISRVWARAADGSVIDGSYQRHIPTSGTGDFPAEEQMKMPASRGSGFVVRFPGVIHEGGTDEYLVALQNYFNLLKQAGDSATKYDFGVQNLVGGITPFKIIAGGYLPTVVVDGFASNNNSLVPPEGDVCAARDTGICAAARDFPTGYRFGVSLRLSQQLSGWFHGRISMPTITTSAKGELFEVSIEASPVKVAALDFTVPSETLSQEIKNLIFNGEEWGVSADSRGVRIVTGLEEDRARTLLQLFTPFFKDQATRTSDYWTFKTLRNYRSDEIQRCSDNSGNLAGVVTTNALLYSDGPPLLNREESSLDYKVASPHYESDGKEASGTYDLLIRSDVARCIYGFTDAPIKATLEVLSTDGSAKVASTTISERNGWLVMSAGGFGFSSPIVRAKLSQDKPEPVVSVAPTPVASSTSELNLSKTTSARTKKSVKKSTVCIKGDVKKEVAPVKKKCPKGWKRV